MKHARLPPSLLFSKFYIYFFSFILIFGSVCVIQAANEETKEHLYETLLAECRDTIQAVKEELKTEAVRLSRMKSCDVDKNERW